MKTNPVSESCQLLSGVSSTRRLCVTLVNSFVTLVPGDPVELDSESGLPPDLCQI
jgi:hypothetical protein